MLFRSPPSKDVIDLSSGEDDLHITGAATGDATPKGVAHVDDTLNQPDASGRVLVNLNHPASDPDLFLSPQLAHAVKPHQVTPGNQHAPRTILVSNRPSRADFLK